MTPSRAHAAWREFRDDLQDLGVHYRPSEPPRTLADRVSAGLPEPARDAVRRLALAEERACYAARPSGSPNLTKDGAAARRGRRGIGRARQPLAGPDLPGLGRDHAGRLGGPAPRPAGGRCYRAAGPSGGPQS